MASKADQLYEQAMALRARATPGKWFRVGTDASGVMSEKMVDGKYVGVCSTWLFPNLYTKGPMPEQDEQIANAILIAAAINLLDALPALKAKWEREARRAVQVTEKMMSEVFAASVRRKDPDHPHLYDHRIGAEKLNEMLAALQQPAAQAEEERRT